MITLLRLLRSIGQFDSAGSATIPLNRITVAYAENGRGKTTLSAILRSLATGDPMPILERHRLNAAHPPHVVLECMGGPPAAIFEKGAWNRTVPNLAVFDDVFVDANVYSGLVVESDHRQRLHELILGARGVALNQTVQALANRIEEHNRDIRDKAAAIPEQRRGSFSIEQFLALPDRPNVDDEILAAERQLAAAREQDRNTLALAFFFASLDADPTLAHKVVVLDDPVSSLDEHRALTTVQEIRRLAQRAAQVIVLSHSKGFLCRIWEGTDRTQRSAIRVQRDATGSAIAAWDVEQDSVTEHDRRHAALREYRRAGGNNSREVAEAIRPVLEAFLRVAYPEQFPPGTLLGHFRERCRQRVGTPQEILGQQPLQELHDLVEYANKFHHDTNPAYQTEVINDGELRGFVDRALVFATRSR